MAATAAREPRRWTVEEYMASNVPGRTELIDGIIYELSPQNQPHSLAISRLIAALPRGLDLARYRIQAPGSVALDGWHGRNAPEPDVAVVREKIYATTPEPIDTFVVIEVADSSLVYDRGVKMPLYVNAGIAEVWLVSVPEQMVESFAPERRVYREGESFSVLGVTVPVSDLFGPLPAT